MSGSSDNVRSLATPDLPRTVHPAGPESRRSRLIAANRARMLRAAVELLGERGFEVTMDDVARRAGMARATLYEHFGNRVGLFRALARDTARRADLAQLDVALDHPDPLVGLRAFVRQACRLWAVDPDAWRGIHALAAFGGEFGAWWTEASAPTLQRVQVMVDRLEAGGCLREHWDRERAFAALVTITSFETYDQLHHRCGVDPPAAETILADLAATLVTLHRTAST